MTTLLKPEDVAARLHLSVATLARWRCQGKGPKFVKLGRSVLYLPNDLDRWIDAGRRSATRETIAAT